MILLRKVFLPRKSAGPIPSAQLTLIRARSDMMKSVFEISTCEVCMTGTPVSVLDLGLHPLCDDLVPVSSSAVCEEFPIEILYCSNCRTAHQRFQVPKQLLFPASYHYRARFTADVLNGMASLVSSVESKYGSLKEKLVLDIGCNDGSLLNIFRGHGALTVGIEPTGAYADAADSGHAVYNSFLDEDIASILVREHGHPDFITMTNVFAHISNLPQVLSSLVILSGADTRIIIENHYLGSVLDGNQFDTFYHEHPRTYSFESFNLIARSVGRVVTGVEFPNRYGGNIRVYLGLPGDSTFTYDSLGRLDAEAHFDSRFQRMQGQVQRWRETKAQHIRQLVQEYGPLRAKAFPGRAAILIKLLGLDTSSICVVHEKPGSLKIGHYLPGTRIPIVSDNDLVVSGDMSRPLINLAWHIPNEIRSYMASLGYQGEIVDILDPKDFL